MYGLGKSFWEHSRKHDTEIAEKCVSYSSERYGAFEFQTWTEPGKLMLRVYHGKAGKPVMFGWYAVETSRANKVAEYRANEDACAKWKADKAAARKAIKNTFTVGDVLTYSWGYDQTNIEFFEVVAVSGKSVTIRRIAAEQTETGFMTGGCTPRKGEYIGEPMRKVVRGESLSMRFGCASRWDGKPERWSSYA